ncbi:hypothetical protein NC653_018029 [Populus alba x Populus x berolinensis]|uniref:Uncharacterized protein n=1 Tax=Populus alba x Populus x berolinensis TaxID=444605 RepID=A0AAD6QRR0_9ROSI|nr:hypothetical protein NC653_018029 [Populus alba x Populus x berolinensis]
MSSHMFTTSSTTPLLSITHPSRHSPSPQHSYHSPPPQPPPPTSSPPSPPALPFTTVRSPHGTVIFCILYGALLHPCL